MGLPGEKEEGHESFEERDMNRRRVGSFLSIALNTRFSDPGYIHGGYGEMFPSSTAERIPRIRDSSHHFYMCKYTKRQAQRNHILITYEMLM